MVDKRKKDGSKAPKEDALKVFLHELTHYGNVSASARAAGITTTWLYMKRKEDPEFAAAWDEARRIGDQALEDEARRRAFDGWEEPIGKVETVVNEKGEEIEKRQQVVRKYSDTLLIFLMKGTQPQKFKDRIAAEHSGPDGGPIQHVDLSRLSDAELEQLKTLASKTREE